MNRLHCPACDASLVPTDTLTPGTTCPVCAGATLQTTTPETPTTKGITGTEYQARREALGLSQGELATYIGVHQVNLSRWESGTTKPRNTTILDALNTLENALAGLEAKYIKAATAQLHNTATITTAAEDLDHLDASADHIKPILIRVAAAHARRHIEITHNTPTRIGD